MNSKTFYTLVLSVSIFRALAVNTKDPSSASERRLPSFSHFSNTAAPTTITTDTPTSTTFTTTTTYVVPAPVIEQETCPLPIPDEAFEPAIVYQYLKAPAPLLSTEDKDDMGGRILNIKHADRAMEARMFHCVKQPNEWKARVKHPQANILTLELSGGTAQPNDLKELCLLQDITLVRTQSQLALRLDYGFCPLPQAQSGTKAMVMLGLEIVPDTPEFQGKTPGIKDFFEGVCGTTTAMSAALDFKKAQAYHDQTRGYRSDHCFVGSADRLNMKSAAVTPCFNEANVYTFLTEDDAFGVLPITQSEFAWLSHQIPFTPPDVTAKPIKAYGEVKVDRVCVYFDGITTSSGKQCNNACGKWCRSTEETNVAQTGSPA
jgi:hypothetical protein